jgi:hypothetical protein
MAPELMPLLTTVKEILNFLPEIMHIQYYNADGVRYNIELDALQNACEVYIDGDRQNSPISYNELAEQLFAILNLNNNPRVEYI